MRLSAPSKIRCQPALAGALLCVIALAVLAATPMPAMAQDDGDTDAEVAATPPTATDVLVALREVDVPLDGLQVRTTVMDRSDSVGSALVELRDGTLADVRVVPTAEGWATRDIFFVAGSAESYRAWTARWRSRVESAQRFLAAGATDAEGRRRPQELAPLVWFEDEEESARLWGLNPVTYRLMQTLKMMPSLGGPIGSSGSQGNPAPRRQ